MTAVLVHVLVPCPGCDGNGEIGTHRDYFGNWDTEQCRGCNGMCEVTSERADELRDLIANPPEWDGP